MQITRSIRTATVLTLGVVIVAGIVLTQIVGAADSKPKLLEVGQAAPDFTLKDVVKDKEYQLSKVREKGPVVLIFSSQKCPYSLKADPYLSKLSEEYKEKGVHFLSIDSHSDTPPPEIKAYVEEKKLAFPVLKDDQNKYADAVGATRTPEIFLIGKDGKLLYHGAPSNQKEPGAADFEAYLKTALDEVLEGKAVSRPKVNAWGCTIKRVN